MSNSTHRVTKNTYRITDGTSTTRRLCRKLRSIGGTWNGEYWTVTAWSSDNIMSYQGRLTIIKINDRPSTDKRPVIKTPEDMFNACIEHDTTVEDAMTLDGTTY